MNAVVGKAVARTIAELQAAVAAEDIEEVALVADVEDQARTAEGQRGVGAADAWRRLRITELDLSADRRAEEIAEAPTATNLIVEPERSIVSRE